MIPCVICFFIGTFVGGVIVAAATAGTPCEPAPRDRDNHGAE